MSEWKKVKIDFDTIKLGDFIEPIKTTVLELGEKNPIVYGVTNKEGIVQTGKPASKDISNYIALEDDCFAFNPYRVNVGSIGINDKKLKGCVSPAYVVFRTKNRLLPKFLYFYLKSDYGIHLINWYGNRGGVRNALRYSDLCNIDIPNINHLDQQKILEKFLSVSDKIDEISKEIESQKNYIKQLRQNILQDAIEGKLTADWRKQNPVQKGNPNYDAEALFEQIQKQRTNEKRQKELSPISDKEKPFEIPKGWKWVRLGEISISSMAGKSFACEGRTVTANEWGIIKTSAITSGIFIENENKFYSETKPNDIFTKINIGDFLFCRASGSKGLAGKSCIVEKINSNLLLSDKSIRIELYPDIKTYYINTLNNSSYGDNYRLSLGTNKSTTMNNLTREQILNFVIPLPPLAEQNEIVARIEAKLQTITALKKQIAEREQLAKRLMQSILKEAFEEK